MAQTNRAVTLSVRALNTRQSARDLDTVTTSVKKLGLASSHTTKSMTTMSTMARGAANHLRTVSTLGTRAAVGIGAAGTALVMLGVKYNASLEASRVSLQALLGSREKANVLYKDVLRLATASPFSTGDILDSSRRLLLFGVSSKVVMRDVQALADATSAAGGSTDELGRASLAYGQILSSGRVLTEDLNQLREVGLYDQARLAKAYGVSTAKFRKMVGDGKVQSRDFLTKLRQDWKRFGDASEQMSNTLIGRWRTFKDMLEQTAGVIVEPFSNALRDKALPAASAFMKDLQAVWSAPSSQLDLSHKLTATRGAFTRNLKPLTDELIAWWKRPETQSAFNSAVQTLLVGAGRTAYTAGKTIAREAWDGFMDAGLKAKAITAGVLLTYFGISKRLALSAGSLLFGWLTGGRGKGTGGLGGGSSTRTMTVNAGVVYVNGKGAGKGTVDKVGDAAKKGGPLAALAARLGTTAPMLGGLGLSAGSLTGLIALLAIKEGDHNYPTKDLGGVSPSGATGAIPPPGFGTSTPGKLIQRTGGGRVETYSEGGAMAPVAGRAGKLSANERELIVHVTTPISIDGQKVAEAVHRAGTKKRASR